jgi:hypothetical protein
MHLTRRDNFSHVAAVLEDLAPGKRFLLLARPDVEALAGAHGRCTDTDLVPYPLALVMHMQRAHRAARRHPGHGIDLAECLSIQRQLTWNRLIAAVSGPLAAAYRLRSMPASVPFLRMVDLRHQTYYFAHRTELQGRPIEGYWVGRDLNPRTGEPVLMLQAVVAADAGSGGERRRNARHEDPFTVPILRTWEASVDAGAWEHASGCEGVSRQATVLHYKAGAAAWEPVVALVFDSLTGVAGAAYEQAATQASFSQVGIRHITLALDKGAVSARVIPAP